MLEDPLFEYLTSEDNLSTLWQITSGNRGSSKTRKVIYDAILVLNNLLLSRTTAKPEVLQLILAKWDLICDWINCVFTHALPMVLADENRYLCETLVGVLDDALALIKDNTQLRTVGAVKFTMGYWAIYRQDERLSIFHPEFSRLPMMIKREMYLVAEQFSSSFNSSKTGDNIHPYVEAVINEVIAPGSRAVTGTVEHLQADFDGLVLSSPQDAVMFLHIVTTTMGIVNNLSRITTFRDLLPYKTTLPLVVRILDAIHLVRFSEDSADDILESFVSCIKHFKYAGMSSGGKWAARKLFNFDDGILQRYAKMVPWFRWATREQTTRSAGSVSLVASILVTKITPYIIYPSIVDKAVKDLACASRRLGYDSLSNKVFGMGSMDEAFQVISMISTSWSSPVDLVTFAKSECQNQSVC